MLIQQLKLFFISFAFMLAIDTIWIFLIMKGFYAGQFGSLMRKTGENPQLAIIAGLLAWSLLVVGVITFVLPQSSTYGNAALYGAVLGFLIYGVYDFTNLATITGWKITMTIVDMAWGTFLCSVTSIFAFFINKLI